MDGYGVFSSQNWPKQPGETRALRKGSLNQFACCEKPPFAIERCLKYVAFRYQGTLDKQSHLSHPAMVRHLTLLFALSGVLVWWFGLSFDPGAASSFAVENQGRRRPKNDNRIHTPASSTDRLDYGLTKADKIKLSQLKQAGRQGNWRQVQSLFDSSKDCKIPMFNAYMTTAMRCEQFQQGARMFEKLCKFSLPKGLATYNLAVKLYAKSGQADLARQAAKEALAEFGLDHTLGAAWLVKSPQPKWVISNRQVASWKKWRIQMSQLTKATSTQPWGQWGGVRKRLLLMQQSSSRWQWIWVWNRMLAFVILFSRL